MQNYHCNGKTEFIKRKGDRQKVDKGVGSREEFDGIQRLVQKIAANDEEKQEAVRANVETCECCDIIIP